MAERFPRRNLNPSAEPWGRFVESKLDTLLSAMAKVEQRSNSAQRVITGARTKQYADGGIYTPNGILVPPDGPGDFTIFSGVSEIDEAETDWASVNVQPGVAQLRQHDADSGLFGAMRVTGHTVDLSWGTDRNGWYSGETGDDLDGAAHVALQYRWAPATPGDDSAPTTLTLFDQLVQFSGHIPDDEALYLTDFLFAGFIRGRTETVGGVLTKVFSVFDVDFATQPFAGGPATVLIGGGGGGGGGSDLPETATEGALLMWNGAAWVAGGVPYATHFASGQVILASDAMAVEGTDDESVVTPKGLAAALAEFDGGGGGGEPVTELPETATEGDVLTYVSGAWVAQAPASGGGGTGTPGASAYEIAVANGFVGTETDWLASLHGEDGEDGTDGSDGGSVNLADAWRGDWVAA